MKKEAKAYDAVYISPAGKEEVMILADKIINERKKNGWSQEELAEQLSVSRQSISKWEGAQAIPDIQKIIKMAELFGVSTDYLLKDEMEPEGMAGSTGADLGEGLEGTVRVSMEEANEYLELEEKLTPRRANMVSLCIFAPAVLLFLIGLSEIPGFPISTVPMVAVGVVCLLLMIAFAVFVFIVDGAKLSRFEYLEKSPIETLYGVSGMVKEKKAATEQADVIMIALGVILCIISVIPLLIVSFLEVPDAYVVLMVSVLLLFVCVGVNLFVRAGSRREAYSKLLQEGDYSIKEKKRSPLVGALSSVYWMIAVAIYLAWSFLTNDWGRTWLVWPIAGVAFGILVTIVNAIVNAKEA